MKYLLTILALVASASPLAQPEISGHPDELTQFLHPQQNEVMLTGTAEKTVYADRAIVTLVVQTEAKELATAIAANRELRSRISSSLVQSGVDLEEINSSEFSLSPDYGWFSSKPSSFRVVNRLAIGIGDESHLEAIARIADGDERVQLSNTEFKFSAEDALKLELKERAVAKVLEQKALYENLLGIELTAVSFSDPSFRGMPAPGSRVIEEQVVTGSKTSGVARVFDYEAPTAPSFDEVRFESTINVRFEVRPSAN